MARPHRRGAPRLRRELDVKTPASEENKPLPSLRDPEQGGILYVERKSVTELAKTFCRNLRIACVELISGHSSSLRPLGEMRAQSAAFRRNQSISSIAVSIGAIASAEYREPLARRTSGEEVKLART